MTRCVVTSEHNVTAVVLSGCTGRMQFSRGMRLCALDEMPLFDNRWPLHLFGLDGVHGRLMVVVMRSQMAIQVVVVVVFNVDARSSVHVVLMVHLLGLFHRVSVVMVRLIIGAVPLLFRRFVLDARVRWPAGRGLPMGPIEKTKKKKRFEYFVFNVYNFSFFKQRFSNVIPLTKK